MNKRLTTLILITLVLVVFAVVAVKQEDASVSNTQAGKALFPGLKQKVNDVAVIEARRGDQSVTVELKDNRWQVRDKDGYYANLVKVKQTILGLADMSLVEAKTKKKDNYKKLEVEEPASDKDKSTLVTLKDAQNKVLASVILGKVNSSFSHPESSTMYVRKAKDDQVWLVKGELHATSLAQDWLDDELINIAANRVQRVSVTPAQGKPFTVQKADQKAQHFVLADMPKGKAMKSESVADAMARVINGLRLLDVQKAADFDPAKDKPDKGQAVKAEFQTFDGLIITTALHKQGNHTYLTLAARFDAAVRPAPAAETDAKTDKADADKADVKKPASPQVNTPQLKAIAAVQQEAADLNERLKGWVFQVADSKVSALNKTAADLLKADKH